MQPTNSPIHSLIPVINYRYFSVNIFIFIFFHLIQIYHTHHSLIEALATVQIRSLKLDVMIFNSRASKERDSAAASKEKYPSVLYKFASAVR